MRINQVRFKTPALSGKGITTRAGSEMPQAWHEFKIVMWSVERWHHNMTTPGNLSFSLLFCPFATLKLKCLFHILLLVTPNAVILSSVRKYKKASAYVASYQASAFVVRGSSLTISVLLIPEATYKCHEYPLLVCLSFGENN